jgi:hypothetical protein
MSNLQTSETTTYDDLASTTLAEFMPTFRNQVERGLPFFAWMTEAGRRKPQAGGTEIIVPVVFGENTTTKMYGNWDILDNKPSQDITVARYQWKQMATGVSISGPDERKNQGKYQMLNLLQTKVDIAKYSMQRSLSGLLFGVHGDGIIGGTGKTGGDDLTQIDSVGGANYDSGNFNSLDHFVRMPWGNLKNNSSASACAVTVGTIQTSLTYTGAGGAYGVFCTAADTPIVYASSQNPWWLNYSIPGPTRSGRFGVPGAFSVTELNNASQVGYNTVGGTATQALCLNACMISLYNRLSDGVRHPDLGLVGEEGYGMYEGACVPFERITNTKMGDLGFANLQFKGMTLMMDPGLKTTIPTVVPTASLMPAPLYMLNSDTFKWVVHPDADFKSTGFISMLPNQDAKAAQILLQSNLVCNQRNLNGVICMVNASTKVYNHA